MMRYRIWIASLLLGGSLHAQINVSGDVSGIWGETSTDYRVVGDIVVPSGQSLTILPGVTVRFMDDFDFTVYGGLVVNGVADDSVRFSYYYGPIPGSWGMIEFNNTLPDINELNYCLIESGDRAIYVQDGYLTANNCLLQGTSLSPLRAENSQITLSHCIITNGGGSGLSLQSSTVNLIDCEITQSGGLYGRGINASEGTYLTITGGYIGQNSGAGIYGLSLSGINLTQVEIAENGSYGVTLTSGAELDAYRVLIHHNASHGIFLSSNSIEASNLTISGNESKGIFIQNGVLQLTSSIVDRNANQGIYCQFSQAFIGYNCVYGNSENYVGCVPGTGSIQEDPLYVSEPEYNYYLQADSPCIDTGSPADPLDPDGTRTDMGAFYYDQTPVAPENDPRVLTSFQITSAYPNPFNPRLTITMSAARSAQGILQAFTQDGRLAANIWKGTLHPGLNTTSWSAGEFAAGLYILRLRIGNETHSQKCVLLK